MNFAAQAQSAESFFEKYAENETFRYVSISKGMVNLSSLFGKADAGNQEMLTKIDEMKLLTLGAPRKSDETKVFFTDIERFIAGERPFQVLMEARENNVHTRVLSRPSDQKNKSVIVIISKSDSTQHFIWLHGSLTTEELQNMIRK
ncbi:MAG: DUF4252 domain-containing protein [Prevotellaceae bacterium]|nr:DUF4252 domain-containing protein [Prevotellaceae bacterium]